MDVSVVLAEAGRPGEADRHRVVPGPTPTGLDQVGARRPREPQRLELRTPLPGQAQDLVGGVGERQRDGEVVDEERIVALVGHLQFDLDHVADPDRPRHTHARAVVRTLEPERVGVAAGRPPMAGEPWRQRTAGPVALETGSPRESRGGEREQGEVCVVVERRRCPRSSDGPADAVRVARGPAPVHDGRHRRRGIDDHREVVAADRLEVHPRTLPRQRWLREAFRDPGRSSGSLWPPCP